MTLHWAAMLHEQLDWHWRHHLRPRLDGLTDDEYFWEPVPGCWSVRRRGEAVAKAHGSGEYVVEYVAPEPDPAPVTTVAWRLAHLVVDVFGQRAGAHFGSPPMNHDTHEYAGTAAEALAQLDTTYAAWSVGVRGLDAAGLAAPCGPAEGPWAQSPMADLVLHINREAIHHGAEILVLRDLYRQRSR